MLFTAGRAFARAYAACAQQRPNTTTMDVECSLSKRSRAPIFNFPFRFTARECSSSWPEHAVILWRLVRAQNRYVPDQLASCGPLARRPALPPAPPHTHTHIRARTPPVPVAAEEPELIPQRCSNCGGTGSCTCTDCGGRGRLGRGKELGRRRAGAEGTERGIGASAGAGGQRRQGGR